MGFFDTLRHVLGREKAPADVPADPGLAHAWGLNEPGAEAAEASAYDRAQWLKKLKRVLGELPASKGAWPELMADARALGLETEWVLKCQTDEFLLMVRRAVADGHFTETEHRKLDMARDLIGIPEDEAEAALHTIVAEAETFFGKPVDGA